MFEYSIFSYFVIKEAFSENFYYILFIFQQKYQFLFLYLIYILFFYKYKNINSIVYFYIRIEFKI